MPQLATQLELSDEQQWLFVSGPQPTFLIGGMGAGKTWVGCLKVLYLASLYPKSNIAIVRRAYRQLRATTMQTFYQLCDPSWIADRNDTDGICRLKNGSEIRFLHLDAENSLGVLASLELSAAYVDQVEEVSDRAWDTLTARVGRCTRAVVPDDVLEAFSEKTGRTWPWCLGDDGSGAPVPPRYIFAVGYATDEMHWLEERLSPKSEAFAHWRERGYQRMIADSRTNRRNLTKAYLSDLLGRDEEFVRRFVRGESGNPEAHVFRVDPDSVLEPEPSFVSHVRNTMILHRSLDHGESERSATCCLWFATDGEGNAICYQEYYQIGRVKGRDYTVSDFRRAITHLSKGLTFRTNLADPAIFDKRRGLQHLDKTQRWSIADEYSDRRMIQEETQLHWTPAENGEAVTRSRLREYLKLDPNHKHPVTRQLGAPHLYFIRATTDYPNGCKHVLAEIRAARYVEISRQGDRPIYGDDRDENIPDHALDACVAPETRILRADLRWVPAAEIVVGDVLVGFDEHTSGKLNPRRWRPAPVQAVKRVVKLSYRLTFADGTNVVCSADHQWLSIPQAAHMQGASHRDWILAEALDGQGHWGKSRRRGLLAGDRLVLKPFPVWETDESRGAGYLAGMFDGEGSVSHGAVTMAQKDNIAFREVCAELDARGFHYGTCRNNAADVFSVYINGGLPERLRFLGSVRPGRLLGKLDLHFGRFQTGQAFGVVKREALGAVEVVAIQTKTRTYVAEGFASHNCRYFVVSRPGLAVPASDPTKPSANVEESRVIMTVPKLDIPPPGPEYKRRGDWRSKAGGY